MFGNPTASSAMNHQRAFAALCLLVLAWNSPLRAEPSNAATLAAIAAHAELGLGLPDEVKRAISAIDAQRIRAHVRFLADDLLEGRGTGTRGGDIAARYIATQFALDGLQPAGDDD